MKKIPGVAVNPSEPTTKCGYYWGYSVRFARTFSKVFSECPYADGYDLTVGTSERGKNLDHVEFPSFR
ncbi:unnamed protein product [Soboliphyme baturini]|uniref:Uncharacterized protein n=1 Tax=Soboliphyme baturini TaxID=241478 RepID=A0A183JB04_9BILA|nr:unnamed protein product [Soboliphyme baturini]